MEKHSDDLRKETLVPIEQVIDDMYGDKGPISWAARDYYKTYYASDEERAKMDREDKIDWIIASTVVYSTFGLLIISILFDIFN